MLTERVPWFIFVVNKEKLLIKTFVFAG